MKMRKIIIAALLCVMLIAFAAEAVANDPSLYIDSDDHLNYVYVEYKVSIPEDRMADLEALLDARVAIMGNKTAGSSFPNSIHVIDNGAGIRVEYLGTDPADVAEWLGSPVTLSFIDPDGNEFMNGDHVKNVSAKCGEDGRWSIILELDDEGVQIFGDATANAVNKRIRIVLDTLTLLEATIMEPLYINNIAITYNFTEEQARFIVALIECGDVVQLTVDRMGTMWYESQPSWLDMYELLR